VTKKDLLSDMENERFVFLIRRSESLLWKSFLNLSYPHFEKAVGLPWNPRFAIHTKDNEIVHLEEDVKQLGSFFESSTSTILKFRDRLLQSVNALEALTLDLHTKDFSACSNEELIDAIKCFSVQARLTYNFLLPFAFVDKMISSEILSELKGSSDEKQELLGLLTLPTKENEHINEKRDFLNLVLAFGSNNFEEKLGDYLDAYAWVGARGMWFGRAWNKDNIKNRVDEFLNDDKDPKEELLAFEVQREKNLKESDALLRKLGARKGSKLYDFVHLARDFAYLRTWRTDKVYWSAYLLKDLFEEAIIRFHKQKEDVVYYTWLELLTGLESGEDTLSKEELEQRKKSFAIVANRDALHVFSDDEELALLDKALGEYKQKEFALLKGVVAFKGRVRGPVKVIRGYTDLGDKVKKGDILVAVMTFPSLVTAMERAAAFVTDEGGILCHATIIAREMKKPCVIGTKHATTVFNDGDLVEVDANTGLIRKLDGF